MQSLWLLKKLVNTCEDTEVTFQTWRSKCTTIGVAVSCGYSTCFGVSACDGLCHLTKVMDRVETPFGFQPLSDTL